MEGLGLKSHPSVTMCLKTHFIFIENSLMLVGNLLFVYGISDYSELKLICYSD